MRTLKLLAAAVAAMALMLGPAVAVLAQDEAEGGPSPYFYGEAEGIFHHDMDNPLGCAIGFTSDATVSGESTLGPVTVRQVNCYVPTDTLNNAQDATVTYTFESGDTLSGTATGDCIPDMVVDPDGVFSCVATTIITGGTGSFEGASGEIRTIGYIGNVHDEAAETIPDAPYSMIFEGLVEY